jgi:hypothetical protein
MKPYTVIYVEPGVSVAGIALWQFFECLADDARHAEEQCRDAYPTCGVLVVNAGHGPASQTTEAE